MSFTLTSFTENIFRARDTVARELIGFIPGVLTNSDTDEVSINGTVNSLKTGVPTLNTSLTPSMTIPEGDAQTIENEQMTLNKVANVQIPLTGEDTRKLENVGQYQEVIDDMFTQGIRAITNQVELDIGSTAYLSASRAVGTAGTAPFGSDFKLIPQARQILVDNGAGESDLCLVMNTLAGTNLRSLANLFKVNEAGSDATLRNGELLNLMGLSLKESAGVASHTKGTGTGDTLSGTPAIGSTELTFSAFTTGEYVAGDVIVIEDDPNKYVIASADAAANKVTIQAPGLRKTGISGKTITVGADYTANLAFRRPAIELALRPYAVPAGGDAASDRMVVSDDRSPLVFDVNLYRGYKKNMIEMNCVYGVKVWKPEFLATVLG